jgi:hypothetical protein
MGDSGEIYYQAADFSNNCTKRGICRNSTCFCQLDNSSDDYVMTFKQNLEHDIKFSKGDISIKTVNHIYLIINLIKFCKLKIMKY